MQFVGCVCVWWMLFDVTITLVDDTQYSLSAASVFDGCYFDVSRAAQ